MLTVFVFCLFIVDCKYMWERKDKVQPLFTADLIVQLRVGQPTAYYIDCMAVCEQYEWCRSAYVSSGGLCQLSDTILNDLDDSDIATNAIWTYFERICIGKPHTLVYCSI